MTVRDLIDRISEATTNLEAEVRVDSAWKDLRIEGAYLNDDGVVMIETEGP